MTRASDTAKLLGAGATILDGTTISTADNTVQLTLTSTDADANTGPNLVLQRDSASPADNDLSGTIKFIADNDAGEATDCVSIFSKIIDASNGSEDASLLVNSIVGGSQISRFNITPTEIALNDDSIDSDFRVESNGNANMLFVDGGNDKVGIGTNAPQTLLHLQGSEPDIFLRRTDLTNKSWRLNVQSSTGDLNIKSRNDDGSASTTSMVIAHDGYVTKPLQPSFLVNPSSNQNDLAIGTNTFTTIVYGNERYDVGSNFASNTFTAPVTGKYMLFSQLFLLNVDKAQTYIQHFLKTSNLTYSNVISNNQMFSADVDFMTLNQSVVTDMDANDTAFIQVNIAGGTQQMDVRTDSFFGGILIG